MKLKFTLLFAVALTATCITYGQEEKQAAPAATAPRAARPMPQQDSVKGNAAKEVGLVASTAADAPCANGLKGVSIANKSATKSAIAQIEMTTIYNGRGSKKLVKVDNLSPGETRAIGCMGCINNPMGKTCTTYKLLVAVYK